MSKKTICRRKNPVDENVQEAFPLYDPERVPLHEHYGPKEFWIRLHERFEPEEVPYGPWYRAYSDGGNTGNTEEKEI